MIEDKKLVPKRRFAGFTREWEETKLGEVIDRLYNGQTPSRFNESFWNGNINWLSSGELNRGEVSKTIEKITIDGQKDANLRIVPRGTFVMAITGLEAAGTRGNCAMLNIDTTLNQSCMAVYPSRNKLNSLFLFQWYKKVGEEYGLRFTQGTKQQSYNAELIKDLKITLPSVDEQQKVGHFFKRLDEQINLQQRTVDKAKAFKAAYLAEMFPAEGKTVPKRRFAGFTGEWEETKLGEVIDRLYNGQTPSRFNESFWNGNINWLSSGELNRGEVSKTIEKITTDGQKDANLRIVPRGTFVMAITGLEAAGTRGNCAMLNIDTTLNQSCMAVYPNSNRLDSLFLFQWYKKVGEEYGLRFTQGTKQQSYNAELIKDLKIVLPNIKEQQKIGKFFKKLDNKISIETRRLEKLQALKQAYLHEMFV